MRKGSWLTTMAGFAGLAMVCGCGMTGGGRPAARGEAVELLNRPGLVVTQDEYDQAVMRQQAQRQGLSALDEAQRNVEEYDAARAKVLAQRQAQMQAYQDQQAAVVDQQRQQELDARRARITAVSQSVEPYYNALREREAAYQEDAEDVRLRRGVE